MSRGNLFSFAHERKSAMPSFLSMLVQLALTAGVVSALLVGTALVLGSLSRLAKN